MSKTVSCLFCRREFTNTGFVAHCRDSHTCEASGLKSPNTASVKIGDKYLYKGRVVEVLQRVKGSYHKTVGFFPQRVNKPKTFILSSGDRVRANKLLNLPALHTEVSHE